jgi:AraC family transcriptional activator of tynA and feaB
LQKDLVWASSSLKTGAQNGGDDASKRQGALSEDLRINASDISNNIRRCERTQSDVRADGVDHCYAVFQIAGRSTIMQNDHAVTLSVGDVALIDSARPVTYVNDGHEQWLSLQLLRQPLISHLGFEPRGGSLGRQGTRAGRLLHQLILDSAEDERSMSETVDNFMQFAVYDLIGALFVPSNGFARPRSSQPISR